MSQADIERFITDIKGNEEMLGELQKGSTGLAHAVDYAKSKGYDITLDDAKSYISAQANADLSDDQLDAVAGGKDNQTSSSEVSVATNVSTAAEVSSAAVAVSVIVLT